jgi:hypothetical protein
LASVGLLQRLRREAWVSSFVKSLAVRYAGETKEG